MKYILIFRLKDITNTSINKQAEIMMNNNIFMALGIKNELTQSIPVDKGHFS
jgi:hypothetical protein